MESLASPPAAPGPVARFRGQEGAASPLSAGAAMGPWERGERQPRPCIEVLTDSRLRATNRCRLSKGGRRALDVITDLFEAQSDALYRYARHVTGSGHEAEDIVQSVFLRAVRAWPSFAGRSSPETWLWSIARHALKDWARKRARDDRHREASLAADAASGTDPEPTEWERLLQGLPLRERHVVILRIVEDLSTSDAARRLGMSEGHVRVVLNKAMARLRDRFRQREGSP